MRLTILMVVALFVATTAAAMAAEFIVNGEFNASPFTDGWTRWGYFSNVSSSSTNHTDTVAHPGSRSMKCKTNGAAAPPTTVPGMGGYQEVVLGAGTYDFSAWLIKSDGDADKAGFRIYQGAFASINIDQVIAGTGAAKVYSWDVVSPNFASWTQCTTQLNLSAGTYTVFTFVYDPLKDQAACFDDISLVDVPQIVPEPGAFAAFAVGLVGLVGLRRRR